MSNSQTTRVQTSPTTTFAVKLCVRGPRIIGGYLDEKATVQSWDKDGFFQTGDVAYCARDSEK